MTSSLQQSLTSCLPHLMYSSCSAKSNQSCDTNSCKDSGAFGARLLLLAQCCVAHVVS
jgi:hypothetical protein